MIAVNTQRGPTTVDATPQEIAACKSRLREAMGCGPDARRVHEKWDATGTLIALLLWCPGCVCMHRVPMDGRWTYNGDPERPTLSPSLDYNRSDPATHCHSFVQNGQWQFLGDCHHSLKGQTVPLEPF